jgi:hypothetical protein
MEEKRCRVFVNGKECGLPLTILDGESEKGAPYDIAAYACGLGHRSHLLPESKTRRGSTGKDEELP